MGFLFLILYPGLLLRPPPHFVHTHFINKHFVQNTLSTHTLSTHTLSPHTLSTNTLSTNTLSTHALSTYTLCPHTLCHHTLCPQTLCPQTLCPHTLYQHTLCHHNTHTQHTRTHTHTPTDTTHNNTHTTRTHTHTPTDTTHNNTTTQQHTHTRAKDTWWQAWHNLTSTFVSRGRRGTNSHLPSFHVAGVPLMVLGGALGPGFGAGAPRHFAWQAWHNLTSTFVSRGRRGTISHLPSFCVAGVPLMVLGGALGPGFGAGAPCRTLRGRRGTTWHPPSFHVAGVAQTHIYCRFAWQASHWWYWVAPLGRDLAPGRRATLRGRRGTTWHPPSFHVAGVAQTHIYLRFTWQACHWWYWVAPLGRDLAPGRRATLRGRRGTIWHPPSFHVAGVAQSHIYRRFAWQACHLWYWVAPLGRDLAPGRRAALCVAGVAQPDIHLRFTWQAWHKLTSTVVLRGRRATDGTGWRPWAGIWRRGAAPLCVAGVAQPDIHLRFTWQAWHKLTSTFVSRGRRGTHGTGWRAWTGLGACDAAALCVAGVAQTHIYCRFAWQAWHKLTSTVVLRGRRGTDGTGWRAWTGLGARDAAALCVAGVAQTHIYCRFAWQAWHKLTSTVVLRGRRGTHGTGWRALCHTPPFIHHLSHITLSHTIFHTPLCHIPSLTHRFVTHHFVTPHLSYTIFHTSHCHTPSFTHHFVTYHLWHTALSHPTFHTPSFTHHIVTHHLSHTTLSHTIFDTPLCQPLCHTPPFIRHLSHITLSHTFFHTPLCHIPSLTHRFVTQHFVSHHLSPHHPSHTTLSHTIFHHTIFHTQLCRTPSFTTPSLTQLCHTPSFAKPSFTHHFVTHHLSHTTLSHALFHTQLSHTPSFTHHFVTHTIFLSHTPAFTYNFVTHNFVLLLDPPPPPLSFLPSPSPLQHLVLIIQRSCLVGLSGPLILSGTSPLE